VLSLVLALAVSQAEPPPESRARPAPAEVALSVPVRATLSIVGGVLGAAAGLGLTLLLVSPNPNLDSKFATAAMGALLTTGAVFTIHEVLGGRGEVALAILAGLGSFAVAAAVAGAIDGNVPMGPILIAAIGALPASGLVALSLEATSPAARKVDLFVAPTGLLVRF
jgi:hypothetical protein